MSPAFSASRGANHEGHSRPTPWQKGWFFSFDKKKNLPFSRSFAWTADKSRCIVQFAPQQNRRCRRIRSVRAMCPTENVEIDRFLDRLVEDGVFHSRHEIAVVCGMSDGTFSATMSSPESRKLTVEQCLRLALHLEGQADTDIVQILKMAGRPETAGLMAGLLAKLMRRRRTFVVTPSERKHLRQWRAMSALDRRHLSALAMRCVESEELRDALLERQRVEVGGRARRRLA